MRNIQILLIFLLLALNNSSAQLSASASTSVDIIDDVVGAEKKGEMITGIFFPFKKAGMVEVNNTGIIVNGRAGSEKFETPYFHIAGSQYMYAITFSYDPLIFNRNAVKESIAVESLSIQPLHENNQAQTSTENFSIDARFRVGPSQAPGIYSPDSPCRITIHFN